jgi:hypothetical protein
MELLLKYVANVIERLIIDFVSGLSKPSAPGANFSTSDATCIVGLE